MWNLLGIAVTLASACIGGGLFAARIYYSNSSDPARASRLIDLISFSLAGVGLIASVVALVAFDRRLDNELKRTKVIGDTVRAVSKIDDIVSQHCPRPEEIRARFLKGNVAAKECASLFEYVSGFANANVVRVLLLPYPPLAIRFADEKVREAIQKIVILVREHNDQLASYIFDEYKDRVGLRELLDIVVIFAASTIFAFAFGMGFVRRAHDLGGKWVPIFAKGRLKRRRR